MSDAIAMRPAGGAVAAHGSAELEYALATAADGLRHGLPARVVAEAQAALAAQPVQPAGAPAILAWLKPVVASVRNPPTEREATDRAAALALACADLPAGIWTRAAVTAGMRAWQFWPSVADVRAVLLEQAEPLLARRRALAAVARARVEDAAPPRPAPGAAERARVAALVAALRAEVAGREPRPVRRTARPLTPAQLAAAWAGGKPGEAVR